MWERLSGGSVATRVEQQITQAVAAGRLKPGDRLPAERDLAELLGVSRPSVREAIGALKAKGTLRVVHGRGVFIAEPTAAQELRDAVGNHHHSISDLFAMRAVLEVPAAGWAAQRQDRDALAKVAEAMEAMRAAGEETPRDFDKLQSLDASFHLAIVEAAGNKFLQQTLGVLQSILNEGMQTTLMMPGRVERSRADHERILAALLAGDEAEARAAAQAHVEAARATAMLRLRERAEDENPLDS